MSNYVPFGSGSEYVNPHEPLPTRRDPWFALGIAVSPLLPLTTLLLAGAVGGFIALAVCIVVLLATAGGCVYLAILDQRELAQRGSHATVSPWLALVPAAYLLVRASRRSAEPHRGNPLRPFIAHLVCAFALGYYLVLVLMSVVAVVNRGFF